MWKFLVPVVGLVSLSVLFATGLTAIRDIHALPSPLIGKAAPTMARLKRFWSVPKAASFISSYQP